MGKVLLRGKVHHLAESDMLSLVPSDTMARIKVSDEHPEFRAYAIAHEGAAEGNMVGVGRRVMKYFRDAIMRLHEKLTIGTPIFHRHNADNAHDGRNTIGEICGKTLREIGGKLYDIAVTYIKPEFRQLPLDIASIEADIEFTDDGDGKNCTAVDIGNITGLALSNSAVESPGFPGATLLAAVQAFVDKGKDQHNGESIDMELEELKEAIKKGKFKPSEVFAEDDLKKDPYVSDIVSRTGREAARRVRDEEVTEVKEQLKVITGERDTLSSQLMQVRSKSVLETLSQERKLDDKQKKFLDRKSETFKTDSKDDAGLKIDLNKFIDGALEEYRGIAELFGVKIDKQPEKENDPGTPASDMGGLQSDDSNLTDPKNNPLIPGSPLG